MEEIFHIPIYLAFVGLNDNILFVIIKEQSQKTTSVFEEFCMIFPLHLNYSNLPTLHNGK